MESKILDVIVIGATGFTGKIVVKNLAKLTKTKCLDVTWGISGRSILKIQDLIRELYESGLNIKNIPILESDITNQESLKKLSQAAKIVINCTGPESTLSPPIIEACLKTGTHYLDISANIFHILTIYKDYNKAAEDANILVIPACGYAVIPSESAMIYLERQFSGTLHTVECYSNLIIPKNGVPGKALINYGTWKSVVCVLEKFQDYLALWKLLYPNQEESVPEEMRRSFFHRHNGKIWFPYPGPDATIFNMSQIYLHDKIEKKAVYYKAYTTTPSFWQLIFVPVMFLYYYLSNFECFRKLLINFPRLFSLGCASYNGPTHSTRKSTKFNLVMKGTGWVAGADLRSKPTKTMSVKVSGTDPGYDITATAIIMCAVTVLKERSNLPKGGVVMPGAAFHKTDLVDRLIHNGLTFEVLRNEEK